MRRQIKIVSILLMVLWISSFAAAVQKPAVQQAGTTNQIVIGAQDVITASDAGGGYLDSGDILLIVLIILAVIGLGILLR
jgi:hypothetical protein